MNPRDIWNCHICIRHNQPETNVKVFNAGNKTVVILADGRRGEAKCSPEDEYNPVVGVSIAYGRALAK